MAAAALSWWTWVGFTVLRNRQALDPHHFAERFGLFLLGSRVFMVPGRGRNLVVRLAMINLGRLHEVLSGREYLVVLTAWVIVCTAIASATGGAHRKRLEALAAPTD